MSDLMQTVIFWLTVVMVVVVLDFIIEEVATKDKRFIDRLCYIDFDGRQYVTSNGTLDQRVLTHSPKCKCWEENQ